MINEQQSNKYVNIFWTGGWDSTFRVLQLLIAKKKTVQPFYINDPNRKSAEKELNAMKTVDRVVEIFPANQQGQVRSTLSDALRAVVSQTLFKRTDIKGRCAALEVLIATPAVRNLIREAKTYQIASVMQTGKKYGMQTLDDAIMLYLEKRMISADDAYSNAVDKSKFLKFLRKPPSDFTQV